MLRLSLSLLIPLAGAAAAAAAAPRGPAAVASAPGDATAPVSRARYLMGTVCEGTVYASKADGAAALEAAFDEIARLETILSDYREDSELSRLNRSAGREPVACSDDLYAFIAGALAWTRATGGAFDITVGPLVEAWDLRGRGRVASPSQIREARRLVGARRLLALNGPSRSVRLARAGMSLDPGGLGKGYALDAAARLLRARGIASALLDFGGQILAIGSPPGRPAWTVGVAHPQRRDEEALALELRDASISTSGNAERGLVVDGRLIGHILDPRTGRPAPFRGSASAIAPTGAEADAASTALVVMGPGEGLRWASRRPGLSALFLDVDANGDLIRTATQGFQANHSARACRADSHDEGGR